VSLNHDLGDKGLTAASLAQKKGGKKENPKVYEFKLKDS
jgi:hypothetical protein